MPKKSSKSNRLGFLLILCLFSAGCEAETPPGIMLDDSAIKDKNKNSLPNGATRQESRAWVQGCAARTPKGKTQPVNDQMYELCAKPNFYYSCPKRFVISKRGEQLGMEYKIHFKVYPEATSNERARELLDLAQACLPSIQAVWSRYGAWVNIAMDSDRHPNSAGASLPQQEVWLVNYSGRSNSGAFYSDDQDSFCRVMLHETGHHFGLEDEYYDSACPDRPLVSEEYNPYSIMASIWGMEWDNMDFYSRHIHSVFAEYCGETAPTLSSQTHPYAGAIDLGFPE